MKIGKILPYVGWTIVGSGALVVAIGALIQSALWVIAPLTLLFFSQHGLH